MPFPVDSETYFIQLRLCGQIATRCSSMAKQIDSATSSAFSCGDVGLLAGTFDQGGVEILFDDFPVSTP